MLNAAIKKKFISWFCIVIFTSYYIGTSFFFHTHIINGVTIVHSHIHNNSHCQTQSGGHTEHSITLISHLANFDYNDYLQTETNLDLYLLNEIIIAENTHWIPSVHLQHISLRAPPMV